MNLEGITFFLLLGILLIQVVSSEEISGANFVIKVYNGTVEITNSDYSGNNKNFSFNSSIYNEFSYNFLFIKNTTVSVDLVDKYANCLNEKSSCELTKNSFNMAWNECVRDLNNAGNISAIQGNLTQCTTSLQQKDTEISSKQSAVDECKTAQSQKENQKWIYGVVGVILGILGALLQQGKGKEWFGKIKEKSKEDFNPRQAG